MENNASGSMDGTIKERIDLEGLMHSENVWHAQDKEVGDILLYKMVVSVSLQIADTTSMELQMIVNMMEKEDPGQTWCMNELVCQILFTPSIIHQSNHFNKKDELGLMEDGLFKMKKPYI